MIKNAAKIIMFLLAIIIIVGGVSSCKSKKKIAHEKATAEYNMKVEQSKKDLDAMLSGTTTWTLDEQDARLNTIRSYNIDDQSVVGLISKVETKISMDRAEEMRQAEEEKLQKAEEDRKKAAATKYMAIDSQFGVIATTQNVDEANKQIDITLNDFATSDVPVLIIISKAGGFNDYDRPTTISKFLNYLKDKQQYNYKVDMVKRDGLGKITELELIKK